MTAPADEDGRGTAERRAKEIVERQVRQIAYVVPAPIILDWVQLIGAALSASREGEGGELIQAAREIAKRAEDHGLDCDPRDQVLVSLGKLVRLHRALSRSPDDWRATGWAVVVGDEIDVKTVSPTRRAAIVNWLLVGREFIALQNASDQQIEAMWQNHKGVAEVVPVSIAALPEPPSKE